MSLRRTVPLACALASTWLAGCLDVSPPEGRLACQTEVDCPPSWWCRSDQRCYRTPEDDAGGLDGAMDAPRLDARDPTDDVPGLDAPMPDVPGLDAPGLDAPMLDAPGLDAPGLDAPSIDAPSIDAPSDTGRCSSAAQCDDGLFCTEDLCSGGACTHRARACPEDTNPCTTGAACDEATDACVPSFAGPSTPCRAAAGICDVAENCTGSSATCPPDRFVASTVICRSSAHDCDQAELCTGASPTCPADLAEGDGTPCDRRCGTEACMGGVCSGGSTCPSGRVCLCDTACGFAGDDCP